ncbi:MAG: triose-phosphate isomerase [Vicinamibacterales bacterium]
MSRRLVVAGNWKMNLNRAEAEALATSLAQSAADAPSVDIVVFPPYPWIIPVSNIVGGTGVKVGAQNCHVARSGAFTGEVSAAMLGELCDVILTGHSERRHLFGESDDIVGQKVAAILATRASVMLCAGETLDERQAGQAQAVVARQLAAGLSSLAVENFDRLTIAYEPVWAIGTGVAATPDDAQEMCAFVRGWLRDRFGDGGQEIRVLYGGSVTPDNAGVLFSRPDVDGGLVGGASLKAESFQAIVAAAATVSV